MRWFQTRLVVAGRPPPNTDRLISLKSNRAYAACSACSASANAFLDVLGIFAAAAAVVCLALVAVVFGVGVEVPVGRTLSPS